MSHGREEVAETHTRPHFIVPFRPEFSLPHVLPIRMANERGFHCAGVGLIEAVFAGAGVPRKCALGHVRLPSLAFQAAVWTGAIRWTLMRLAFLLA